MKTPPLLFQQIRLSGQLSAEQIYARFAQEPWSMWLDSAYPASRQGRYDIICARPVCRMVTRGQSTWIDDGDSIMESCDDPFDILRKQWLGLEKKAECELPFFGGLMGYFGYDLARRLESLPELADAGNAPADMMMGLYHWAVVLDHQSGCTWLAGFFQNKTRAEALAAFINTAPALPPVDKVIESSSPQSNMSKAFYKHCFDQVQAYIHAGDCYQVNLAQAFSGNTGADFFHLYRQLRHQNPAPFSACLNLPDLQILSASPERFIQLQAGQVLTSPIKGTRVRHADTEADRLAKKALQGSAKDKAENLMIVDLLRNDLGKTCRPGSIRVEQLFQLQSFADVHHLVSNIRAELAEGCDALHLLRGCFPGGSITGAPKIRAMQIIEELEPQRRGVYCGSIAYMNANGDMDSNITIRTLTLQKGQYNFKAGGGLVADSDADQEYQETLDKVAGFFSLFAAGGYHQE
ncbi:MAG: aminodeoxychorismate synthase component I [gamma proteobacterium symbiont of Bathyaustriella thionipta]|nr:aminodeoxychorismate synthase component I [gamma proteobacterium symbiont of Bathyaustriella thionipta]